MNILNDKSDITSAPKPEIEQVENEKQEYRLLGTKHLRKGLLLFSWNPVKGEVNEVKIRKEKTAILKIKKEVIVKDIKRPSVATESDNIYFQALNMKNAIRRVERFIDTKDETKLYNL